MELLVWIGMILPFVCMKHPLVTGSSCASILKAAFSFHRVDLSGSAHASFMSS